DAAEWIAREAAAEAPRPSNLKRFSASHFHHVEQVWRDEDARAWHARPGGYSSSRDMPWTRIAHPAELGATPSDAHDAVEYLFVDSQGLGAARGSAAALDGCPGSPAVLGDASVRFAAERFQPQQTKRLGPGLLAAEIVIAADRLAEFLPAAERLASGAGV